MGRINENGDWEFEFGHGSGPFGMPYNAANPMREYDPPFWAVNPESRRMTLLERRAMLRKPQSGTYEERLNRVTRKLGQMHAKELEQVKAKKDELLRDHPRKGVLSDYHTSKAKYLGNPAKARERRKRLRKRPPRSETPRYYRRKQWLDATANFANWLERVIELYYPAFPTPLAYDRGQVATLTGVGLENKFLLRKILQELDRIGRTQFPVPRQEPDAVATVPAFADEEEIY
jgi:hypothetical protein